MKRYLLTIIAATVLYMPATAQESDTTATTSAAPTADAYTTAEPTAAASTIDATTKATTKPNATSTTTAAQANAASPVKFSAVVDMQVDKLLYDDFNSTPEKNNRISNALVSGYRQAFDDFWLRVGLKGMLRLKYLESAFDLKFYPYWTLRRQIYTNPNEGTPAPDLHSYLDFFEVNQAYFKVFKEYSPQTNLTFKPHIKIGRDGMLNSCSQLFGNYLDQPAGGYGASRYTNIAGPFKNRKISANQMELGFIFNCFDIVGGATSLMIGGNLSNGVFYGSAATQFWQIEDSKLSAGFVRAYQDLYFMDNRFHAGIGFRNYTSIQDTAGTQGHLTESNCFAAQWAFDAVIVKDVKFYSEMSMQKMSSDASSGIVRPINVGITLPTFGVLDTLAVEIENVANTFFSDKSMRDPVAGRDNTKALGWGIVVEKRFLNRIIIDWGLYSGNPTGDMKTTLRLTSLL